VLQEAYANTETAAFADVLLPATSWGEKEGTVTNSERRISRVRAALPPPFEARHDWAIACDFAARKLGPACRGNRDHLSLPPPSSLERAPRATRGRDLDITGLSYAMLERDGPQQWPFPEGATAGTRASTRTALPDADGRARFFAERYRPWPSRRCALSAAAHHRRLRDQWHGMSRTGTVATLFGHAPEPRLAMNASDMARRGIAEGDLVRVRRAAARSTWSPAPTPRSARARCTCRCTGASASSAARQAPASTPSPRPRSIRTRASPSSSTRR
jgi:assimilatory nitrate reductase catalytic subunit